MKSLLCDLNKCVVSLFTAACPSLMWELLTGESSIPVSVFLSDWIALPHFNNIVSIAIVVALNSNHDLQMHKNKLKVFLVYFHVSVCFSYNNLGTTLELFWK